jgi:hypothetical protein
MNQYHSSERRRGTERERKMKRHSNTALKLSFVAEFEVLIALMMNSIIFWDVTQGSPVVHRCFGETYCLHLQDKGISQTSSQQGTDGKQNPSNRLHYIRCQETVLFLCYGISQVLQ